MSKSHLLTAVVLGFAFTPLSAQHLNTTLLQHWKRTGSSTNHNDVWGMTTPAGKEFAICGERLGISILDATDPRSVRQVGWFTAPGGSSVYTWRDYTSLGKYFYAVSEHYRGIRVFEIQANGTPRDHGYVQTSTITSAHNIRCDPATGHLYVVGGNNRGLAIFDASLTPTNPKFISIWNSAYVHDACIRRGKAYVCTGRGYQTRILNVSNPRSISQIGTCRTQSGYNHAAWVSDDDKILCVTDEIARNGVTPHMTVWDISNPSQPVKRGDYDPGGGAIAHNVFVIGRSAYMSYYINGFHLIDLANPANPTKIASYDTSSRTTPGYYGAWGCFPFQDSGVIYVSDMQNGFYSVQVNCGHMNRFGMGTAGSAGIPHARFDGAAPRIGASKLRFEIKNLEPNQLFWIVGSTGAAPTPMTLLGAKVNIDLATAIIVGPVTANANGTASVSSPVPNNPGLGNARVYLQLFSHRGNGSLTSSRGMWAGICR